MGLEVDLTNFNVLREKLTGPGFIEGLLQGAEDVVELASQLAPEDTGALKTSGKAEVVGDNVEISFGNDLSDDRAIAQEFGTLYMPAQPYIWPAIKSVDLLFHVREKLF